jgi:hypothetical protein
LEFTSALLVRTAFGIYVVSNALLQCNADSERRWLVATRRLSGYGYSQQYLHGA